MKKEDTPMRIARRNYEERNKELRKKANAQFSTFIPEFYIFFKAIGVHKVSGKTCTGRDA